jgi:PAS domain S-box-containing protein
MNVRVADIPPRSSIDSLALMEILGHAAVAIAILDRDMRYLFANHRYMDGHQLPQKDLVGRSHYELFPELPERWKEVYRRCLAGAIERLEAEPCPRHAGKVDRVSWEIRPWHEPTGKIGGLVFSSDVTVDHRAIEDSLVHRDHFFRTILEDVPDLIRRWRSDGIITYVNQNYCDYFGKQSEELIGRTFLPWIPAEDQVLLATAIEQLGEGAPSVTVQHRVILLSGEIRWLEWIDRPLCDARGNIVEIQSTGRDITAGRRDEQFLEARTKRTVAAGNALSVLAMSSALAAGEVERFARELTEQAARATGVERASVWLFDESETLLRCIDLYEATPAKHSSGMELVESQYGPEFLALKSAPYVDANDALTDPRTSGYRNGYLCPLGITSMLDTLVSVANRRLGVVCLEHVNLQHEWQPDEVEFACRLGDKVGLALSNRETRVAQMQWQAGLEQTVRAIANTVEIRDPFTAGHQERVAQLAEAIAHELGLSEHQIRGLSLAAFVHDVGKVRVPADILNKPRALNYHEMRLVQTHSEAGHDILKDVQFPWPIAEFVLQHHERLDGSGYPRGLMGDEILLEARIIAVADVVEAMCSHRPYRPALGIDAALAEIEASAGTRYDGVVVDACLRLFRNGRLSWH